MKTEYRLLFKRIFLIALLSALILNLLACGQAAKSTTPYMPASQAAGKTEPSPLTVLSIAGGDIFIMKPGDKEWIKGQAGMTLGSEYKVKAGADGLATITFFEGSTIELTGDTELVLAQLGISGTSSTIKLKQTLGQTVSRVKKLADSASRYEIETPAAVAAVRGSIMFVSVAQDGKTVVGNIEGLISAIAQGEEVRLPENTHVNIAPGSPPEPPKPGANPPAPTPTPSIPAITQTTPVTPPDTDIAALTLSVHSDIQKAFPGDSIKYSYVVGNGGDVSLAGISVTANLAERAEYERGDKNTNNVLDVGETWIFVSSYVTKPGDVGLLTNAATVSGTSLKNKPVTAASTANVEVTDIFVRITSLNENTRFGEIITVAGTVNDRSIKQAVMIFNGVQTALSVDNGLFSTTVNLVQGTNSITVTVTKAPGITRSDSVQLVSVYVPPAEQKPSYPTGHP